VRRRLDEEKEDARTSRTMGFSAADGTSPGGNMKQWIRASLGLAILWPALAAVAQNTNSGEIRGVVTDSSGAIIPGATVKVDDVDKGISHIYTTDSSGLYDTGSIVPDHYLITITAPGFQSYVRGPITLQVATVTIDAAMTVGAAQQQIVVKTDVPLLQTENGTQSTTFESQQMLQLPQVGADWENFVALLPGASSNNYRTGQTASINGNLPYSTVLADGATTTLPMSSNSDVMVLETVGELKIDDSAFSAQYGIGGATFNQISKGGTNQFHGAGYEFFENNALNAADYAFGANNTVGLVRYNNFGFAVGGPIIKDKVFFYFNYDKTINPGSASTGFENVPTPAMLGGDFTGFQTLYDPTTQTVDSTGKVLRKTFADEYGNGNKIPAGMISPVASAISKYYPAPNVAGATGFTNNFFYNVPSSNPFTKYFGRLDWQINANNHFIASETSSDNPAYFQNQGICPINCQSGDVSRDNAQVSWVSTLSARTINEARMGFTDQLNFFQPASLGEGFPAKLGLKFAKADLFPDVNVSGNGGGVYELSPNSNAVYKEFVFDPSDVVTLIRGRHVLHFGGEFLISRADSTAWGNQIASHMNYTGTYTSSGPGDSTTGMAFADFLLGYANEWDAKQAPEYGGRIKSPQFFAQDDIKLRPNLTINVGLRWQGLTGWHEVKGNMLSFDPTVANPANGSLGAVWYGTTKANGRDSLQAPAWNTWLPRFGFSYGHGPKTVLRGGIGLYGYTWSNDTYGPGLGNALAFNGTVTDSSNGINPVVLLDSDGNTNYQGAGGLSVNQAFIRPVGPAALNGQSVPYQAYHTPVPKILEWNFEVQQQINTSMVFTASYVASHGYDLLFPADINAVPEQFLSANDNDKRPYPLFKSISSGNQGSGGTNNGVSNYNSLQTTVSERLSRGLSFSGNYTWSHMLTSVDSSGWGSSSGNDFYQRPYDVAANYGASNFDVRNAVKGWAIYDLPFGKGRQFLNNNWLADEAIGGWQVSPTIVWTSGFPYTLTTSSNNSFDQTGNGQQFPNQISSSPNPSHKTLKEWYNPAAFAQPTAGTYGDTRRNSLYGPQFLLVNAAVGKTFHIPWEGIGLEIRASANNVLNHPSFAAPNASIGDPNAGIINSLTVFGRTMQLYGRVSF
jgi:Carboxypeptidase regulatory-like domain